MRKLAKLRRDEAGYALVWVLVLLIVAGLLLIPLLLLMTTGLTSSDIREESTQRFYSADAGIEDGMYKVFHGDPNLPAVGDTYPYSLAEQINGSTVAIEIYGDEEGTYRITATATDEGSKTTVIESYVSITIADFSYLLDNAITSTGNVSIGSNSAVTGPIQIPDAEEDLYLSPGATIDEDELIESDPSDNWPTAEQFSAFYQTQVDVSDPFPDDTIDLKYWSGAIGPLYRDGSLTIKNTASDPETATLGGTVYVTGDLAIGLGGNAFTLDLSGHTIYAEGNITLKPNCNISGSGCIIAVGYVDFEPNESGEDFVFVMSILDTVTLLPGTSFCGSLAGDVVVELQPGCTLTWTETGGEGLNFPTEVTVDLEVITYTIE